MGVTRLTGLLVFSSTVAAGCGAPAEMVEAPADMALVQYTVGADVDGQQARTLKSDYVLPPAFTSALASLSVSADSLNFPDIGVSFAKDAARFHWTDLVRHSGTNAPLFGHMVARDVEEALALGDDKSGRAMLIAQSTYQNRDKFQSTSYDRAITVAGSVAPLLDALARFYAHPPVTGNPAPALPPWVDVQAAVATQVAPFPMEAQIAVAQCLDGLLAAADLRDRALTGNGTMGFDKWAELNALWFDSWQTPAALNGARTASKAVDFDTLARAGELAVRSVESLRLALGKSMPVAGARLDVTGPLGRVALALDAADDKWSGNDLFLLVDRAGNDTYLDDIAANWDVYHPIAAVVDLSGNDQYHPSYDWDPIKEAYIPAPAANGLGRQAAGMFGVAVLVDAAGDDSYLCPRSCQGYGLFGVGVLIDRGGNDTYKGYDLSQGAADYGFGVLLDTGGGTDRYETLQMSQGYGGSRGIGWLVDDAGDDDYLAIETPIVANWAGEGTNWSGAQGFGFGNRLLPGGPYVSGGLGGLFDLGGNDTYKCAVMCQGFGYFFGTGLLYDKKGDDKHIVSHKYGIGGATHQSVGLFLDEGGADTYSYLGHGRTGGGEGVGLGYDMGVAFHIDRGKEADTYTFTEDIGWIMGFARHPALGVLINEGGNDAYHIKGASGLRSLGHSEVEAVDRSPQLGTLATPSVGMFLDLGGTDTYDVMHAGTGNNTTWIQTDPLGDGWDAKLDHGYGLDSE